MTPNKFQRLFLRQYRELHESKARKRVLLVRMFMSLLGSVAIIAVMSVFLYFADVGAFQIFVPLGAGLVLGNSASQFGSLIRRTMAWDVVEEITDWVRVYELLGEREQDGNS
jgi:hypothetical protein